MQVNFSAKDFHELFAEWSDSQSRVAPKAENEQTIHFPNRICEGWIRRSQLCPGLETVVQNCKFQNPASLQIQEKGNREMLRLGFGITGHIRGVIADNTQEIQFRAGHFGVGFATAADTGIAEYTQGQQVLVATYIDLDLLKTLIGHQLEELPRELWRSLEGSSVPLYFQKGSMTGAMRILTRQILCCPYQGLTKRLYLESKVLELLALSLHQITEDTSSNHQKRLLKSSDLDRIHQASEVLLNNLECPPSLLQLAHQVGLNDYKLKVGFRQMFGTTVFGYLYQQRMQQAQELLMTGELSVATVAETMGYTSLSAFSAAFKRKFGVNPNSYKLRKHDLDPFDNKIKSV
ncbi:MAG: helix-turn-helix transcriptional regulator [Leptolyngbyaceae cyanobacterium RM2_2_4]|nr:helix-turn-helix transcriptional regulator [Leptolyngbyaceae cyanobacterium SM1_4_3]NJO50139.1 helix-turn-helix transcriptional regulator [Leptolyngbyaceae cyanobacterium RM2_2_4]